MIKGTESEKGQFVIRFVHTFPSYNDCINSMSFSIFLFDTFTGMCVFPAGALCFLLVWFCFLFLWSIPMLLVEYGLGRYTRKGVIQSFQQFLGIKATWMALWITLVNFAISWVVYINNNDIFFIVSIPISETQAGPATQIYIFSKVW